MEVLFGLDENSSEEEIRRKAFELIGKIRFIPAATKKGDSVDIRILDFNQLSDGQLYFMTSKGKPVYKQLTDEPFLAINTLYKERYSIRLNTRVEENHDPEIWEEFFSLNPGTMEMYRKDPDIMIIFKLVSGEGELFHLYANDRIKRARFAFGGGKTRPFTYKILDGCLACGICMDNCVEGAIRHENGRYFISEVDCDDCGICYRKCPTRETSMSKTFYE